MSQKYSWNTNSFKINDCDFNTIQSEQLQIELQLKEDIKLNNDELEAKRLQELINGEIDSTQNDEELARQLQEQFNKEELDEELAKKIYKQQFDEELNVKVDNLKLENELKDEKNTLSTDEDSESEEFKREWDQFEKTEKEELGKFDKHDILHSSRMNACKTMNFNLKTGDGGSFDMKLQNNVYNSLKNHVKKERKRFARLVEKNQKSTVEGVFDEKSKLIIFKLINAQILNEVNGIISTGKESNVYHAIGQNLDKNIELGEVAIKIFKTSLNEFKNRASYMRNDYRFNDRLSKSNTHKTISTWAEKEMCNLLRIKKAGILCPDVLMLKKHILVMSFLGKDGKASPTLKEATYLSNTQLERAKIETIEIIKDMYNKCNLVHADLSEYNLMWHLGRVYVLDVGQSVLSGHPEAFSFLLRDCKNISKFFRSRGLIDMVSGSELFCEIVGINNDLINCDDDIEIYQKIRNLEKDNQFFSKDLDKKPQTDLFDEIFNRSLVERDLNLQKDDKMSIKNSSYE